MLPYAKKIKSRDKRGAGGQRDAQRNKKLLTSLQTQVEGYGPCRTSCWLKSAKVDEARPCQNPAGCQWKLMVMFFQPVRQSYRDIFQEEKKKTSLMSNDDFSYVLRFDEKKMFRHQNSCWFLLRLGCWVEMPAVGGGHRVEGPHPISFQCVLIKVPQVIRGDLMGSKRPGCPLM